MNRIDELLKNYLKSDNTDYAIMITGDWGCGKSYYIHHDFNDMLHDICSPKKSLFKRNTGIRTYKSFYISLYGLSSEDDFYARVLVAICPWARENKISLLASKTLNRFGFGFSKKDAKSLLKIPDKAVLVFDDLERISSDKISVKETLGLINSFVEHEFQKVIIVCNENAFGEEDERVLKYYKEKTIRYTYLFESNISEVFDVMLDNVSDECKEYLLNKKTPILQLFKLGGKKNLRTLKFSIDLMNNIYIQISKYSDYKEKILKHIMTSLFIYSMEYKDAHAANELRELKNQLEIDLDWMFPNQNETEKPQKSYSKLASEKYGNYYNDDMRRIPLLIDYIEKGFLDHEQLHTTINEITEEIRRSEDTPQGLLLTKLSDFLKIEDNEVSSSIEKILDYVRNNKYNIVELLRVYSTLMPYHLKHVSGFEITQEVHQIFKDALNRQATTHRYTPMLQTRIPAWDESIRTKDEALYNEYHELFSKAVELNSEAKSKENDVAIEQFLQAVESNNLDDLLAFRKNHDQSFKFSKDDWERIIQVLINGRNPVVNELVNCLMRFIPSRSVLNQEDVIVLEETIHKWLNDNVDAEQRIRYISLQELRRHIDAIINNQI